MPQQHAAPQPPATPPAYRAAPQAYAQPAAQPAARPPVAPMHAAQPAPQPPAAPMPQAPRPPAAPMARMMRRCRRDWRCRRGPCPPTRPPACRTRSAPCAARWKAMDGLLWGGRQGPAASRPARRCSRSLLDAGFSTKLVRTLVERMPRAGRRRRAGLGAQRTGHAPAGAGLGGYVPERRRVCAGRSPPAWARPPPWRSWPRAASRAG